MKRLATLFLSIFLLLSSLSSCAETKQSTSCRELLSAMTNAEISLPAGKIYWSGAEKGEDDYLSASLLNALLGSGMTATLRESWLDIALFLSLGENPSEFAVILCRDRDSAIDTAKLLNLRLSAVKATKKAPEYKEMTENAKVTVIGNYALLIISSDSEAALKIFNKTVR